jgi:hypothetical protein
MRYAIVNQSDIAAACQTPEVQQQKENSKATEKTAQEHGKVWAELSRNRVKK